MAGLATTHGVKEITSGEKNLDSEFSSNSHAPSKTTAIDTSTKVTVKDGKTISRNTNKPTSTSEKRNAARKSKKKARQNKKRGRK